MPRLLLVHHSPTVATAALTEALVAGASDDAIEGVEVDVREALAWARDEADASTIREADGYVLSGHSASRLWLQLHAVEGATVVLNGGSGPGDPPAPD